jgi:prostamide/prostaglandin F2alpha synthase
LEYSVALKLVEGEFTEIKCADAVNLRARNEYDSTGILMVVQLLHWAFQNEQVNSFSLLLTEIKEKFEKLGWTEECAMRVTTIFKAFIALVKSCDLARMRAGTKLLLWDNLVCFVAFIEDHVFFSPTYGFALKPESGCVGIHIAAKGCVDQDLLIGTRELLIAVRASEAHLTSIQDNKAQRKVNDKRQDVLKSCTQFLDAACNYSAVLADCLRIRATFQSIDVDKFSSSISELVEIMQKRRFAKSKKQAITALEEALRQKPVENLDPWSGVKVLTSDTPEGKPVQLTELWGHQRAVVYLVRRFGCPMCLHQATMLIALKPVLDAHEVRLIAVGTGDYYTAKQFKEGLNWPGELYLDPDLTSFKALHLKRFSHWEIARRFVTNRRVVAWISKHPHKAQTLIDGDNSQSGGIFVVGPGVGSSVIFSYKEVENDPLSFAIPEAIVNASCADFKKRHKLTPQ